MFIRLITVGVSGSLEIGQREIGKFGQVEILNGVVESGEGLQRHESKIKLPYSSWNAEETQPFPRFSLAMNSLSTGNENIPWS